MSLAIILVLSCPIVLYALRSLFRDVPMRGKTVTVLYETAGGLVASATLLWLGIDPESLLTSDALEHMRGIVVVAAAIPLMAFANGIHKLRKRARKKESDVPS